MTTSAAEPTGVRVLHKTLDILEQIKTAEAGYKLADLARKVELPKATVYRTHTFFTVYAIQMLTPVDDSTSTLVKHRISAFVLPRGTVGITDASTTRRPWMSTC